MDKHQDGLPTYTDATSIEPTRNRSSWRPRPRRRLAIRIMMAGFLAYVAFSAYAINRVTEKPTSTLSINRLKADYATCSALRRKPVESSGVRDHNKRWIKGTKPLLICNATIWTGEPAPGTSERDARVGEGWSWIPSDVFVDRGIIARLDRDIPVSSLPHDTEIYEANGRLLTSGIVDMHSHAGLASVANLQSDVNELSADITPFVRSIDGLDPLQPEMEFIMSGGVTTSLFLPGSGNNMGGEAYVLKFAVGPKNGREEISQQDLYADPDRNWRYMKMACGENPKRVYGKYGEQGPYSRLGEAWEFRQALEQASKYVQEQDDWCAAADKIGVKNMGSYLKQELKWESLGAVLRGQVRVNTHCYTIPDLEAMVRHTNEFKFRVYAFHHAHQTFLIPEVLKRTWGGTPAAALFADNMYYKVEAYTASERAGAILYNSSITPVYVSDNPVLNSQHVVFEAAKAYGNGLPYHAALAGVTSKPAELLGLGDRIGKVKEGFDADIVVWDSDPLSVGATPVQVWIDGARQFKNPIELKKPEATPIVPDLDLAEEPPMTELGDYVIFTGINYAYLSHWGKPYCEPHTGSSQNLVAIFNKGRLECIGDCVSERAHAQTNGAQAIHLKNGYLTPPFTAFGSSLGLVEIDAESDTHDGSPPSDTITRAIDGLLFGGKQLARAYEHGVTKAISAPSTGSIDAKGISVGFLTNAKHSLDKHAIWKEEVALHYILTLNAKHDNIPSISSAIALLRAKLLDAVNDNSSTTSTASTKEAYEEKTYLKRVVTGTLPLILSAHSADTISSIIRLKSTIESTISSTSRPPKLRIVIIGGAESHLVAPDLAAASIPIVLAPLLPHSQTWDQRRSLTGAPLTNGTTINALLDAGVLTAISVEELWETRDLGLLAGTAYANSEGRLGIKEALDLAGRNVYKALGIEGEGGENDGGREVGEWVVWEGSPLEIGGRVRGIGSGGKSVVWM
ncbi:amidohydrolase [Byssothecium circinans]|uniref:Amidohydrolase n=1 Tax=Byssothecium circinans TaxID=147558 RepID=A0A6A5TQ94_9PLEO|nr:amidohydrolase [Byssothecium circinans]